MRDYNSEKSSEKNNYNKATDAEPVRINKFLSEAGVCSRREADRLVESGKVTVDVYVYTDYQILPGMEYQNTDKTMAVMRSYITALQTEEA
ncbi:MAG: hypothetical protein IJA58_02605, partial [Lachnospiraceae bacterium]|nr:hypothetical protein [Lachnospiraceae bacterium]